MGGLLKVPGASPGGVSDQREICSRPVRLSEIKMSVFKFVPSYEALIYFVL